MKKTHIAAQEAEAYDRLLVSWLSRVESVIAPPIGSSLVAVVDEILRMTHSIRPLKVSVLMPVFNERATIARAVELVRSVPMSMEIICVDDGSAQLEHLQKPEAALPQASGSD